MEIHRYEKFWFAAALLLIVGFIATIAYGAVGAGVQMIDDEGGTVDPNNLSDHERFSYDNVGVYESDQEDIDYEVNIRALHPQFVPATVQVPEDSTVKFYLTSQDVIHGYEVVGTNVNTMVIPGQISEFTAEFDEPEEYGVLCNEYCGSQHHEMEGKLVVVDQEEWNPEEMLAGGGS
jgi:cytochrome c oxidase subunit 2